MVWFLKQLKWSVQYAKLTLKHKWYFAIAGWRLKCSFWSIITHDLSKFRLIQLPYYGRQFFGDKGRTDQFDVAWLHHQNSSPHHWEYWITRSGHSLSNSSGGQVHSASYPLDMPEKYIREMVADWMSASKAYTGSWDIQAWLFKNRPRMRLSSVTAYRLSRIVLEIGVAI